MGFRLHKPKYNNTQNHKIPHFNNRHTQSSVRGPDDPRVQGNGVRTVNQIRSSNSTLNTALGCSSRDDTGGDRGQSGPQSSSRGVVVGDQNQNVVQNLESYRCDRRIQNEYSSLHRDGHYPRYAMNFDRYNNIYHLGSNLVPFTNENDFNRNSTKETKGAMKGLNKKSNPYYYYTWSSIIQGKSMVLFAKKENVIESIYMGILNQQDWLQTQQNRGYYEYIKPIMIISEDPQKEFDEIIKLNKMGLMIRSVLFPSTGWPLVCVYDKNMGIRHLKSSSFVVLDNIFDKEIINELKRFRIPFIMNFERKLSPDLDNYVRGLWIDIVDFRECTSAFSFVHLLYCKEGAQKLDLIKNKIGVIDASVAIWCCEKKVVEDVCKEINKGDGHVEPMAKLNNSKRQLVRENCWRNNYGVATSDYNEMRIRDTAIFFNVPDHSQFKKFINSYYTGDEKDEYRKVYVLFDQSNAKQARKYCDFAENHGAFVAGEIKWLAGRH
ncbi:hypothetical protein KGF57_004641 [Candida theae]|uniref:Uncharacterized protein n=1 Tax=Candida theae TaxID=1198502 RepID=A0AAD5BBV7_9ASCO|nr:uncharacterized protein KGF57_004641 [Candida theae]KAI5949818.1 hypothetical protein KGF57_004641 [Candida theae]